MKKKQDNKMKAVKFLFGCFFILLAGLVQAQEPKLILYGDVVSQNEKSKMDGVKINVKRNGSNFQTYNTDAKGKFRMELPPNGKYILEFTFPEYVTKRLSYNASSAPPEFWAEGDYEFEFQMSLFKAVEGLDVSILNQPIAEVGYDPSGFFNYDKEYTKSVKERIEKLQEDLEELEKEYQEKMASGNKALSQGDFAIAKAQFAAALAVKPGDKPANDKLLTAQEKYDASQAEKNKEKAYTEAIENAEYALNEGNLKEAETQFQKAFDAKPGDIYARDQIKEVRDMMANAAKAEQTYMTSIAKADAALAVSDYLTAKAEYTKASDAKPEDKYAKDQLSHVDDLLVADAKRESDYIQAIERGESSKESKDYEAAKAAFEQASQIKPDEKFPKDQIAEITAILAEIALKSKSYDDAIKRGDAAFAKDDYEVAKSAYEEAIDINPTQQYPKDQLVAINTRLDEMKAKEAQYADLIKDADQRYDSKDFIAAKSEYIKALEIKPNEAHPKARVDEISALLEKEAAIEEDYKAAISNADNAFKAKDYQSAKFEYTTASGLKPNESYPKDQLAKCDEFLADFAKKEEDYANAITTGDNKFKAEDYAAAKESYTLAASIKPEEKYPQEQIALIDEKIVALANLNKEYDESIAAADKLFKEGALEEAKTSYQKALDIKPTEAYPKEQIAAISSSLADAEKKEAEYAKFISDADAAFDAKEYEKSKNAYSSASGLKPDETYPKEKIAEIDKIQGELAEVQKQYADVIAKADKAFADNELEKSLPLYKEAAGLMENEKYPILQITAIESKLDELKKSEEAYTAAIAKAEEAESKDELAVALAEFKSAASFKPEEQYPKEKISAITALIAEKEKSNAAYTDAIQLADEAKKNEEYDIALAQYKTASEVKPNEAYPKDQIKEVEALKASAMEAIELAKKQDEEYQKLITDADKLYESQKFEDSKGKYQAALDLKPTEDYPKTKITEIDATMANLMAAQEKDAKYAELITVADKAFKAKEWQVAKTNYTEAKSVKPEESYPSDQLLAIETAITEEAAMASQQAKDEKYTALIASADEAFKSEDWEKAKADYSAAKNVKPEETYPDEQIKAIDASVAAATALAAKLAAEASAKEKDDKYNALVKTADEAFKSEEWETAKSNYTEAKSVKPNETYPDEQLKAIEAAIGAASALAAKEAAEAAAKEKDEKYKSLISVADAAFKSEDWETAKSNYTEAKTVKPEETYPDEQLKAIEAAAGAAADLAAKEAAEAAAKEKEEKYKALISTADKAFKSKDWEVAKSNYTEAKSVKPSETYPNEQLAAIQAAVGEAEALAAKEAAEAAAAEKQAKYDGLIASADKAFKAKDWENARSNYTEASAVLPSETYPKEQLNRIDEESAEMAAESKEKEYKSLISQADKSFKSKSWKDAKNGYESASAIKPSEQYPKDQIALANEKIAEQESISLQNKMEEDYLQAIGDADQLFNSEQWQPAKKRYQDALKLKSEEVYPKDKIQEIDGKLASLAKSAEKDLEYQELISQADASFDSKDYKTARQTYNKALSLKKESYPENKINEIDEILNSAKAASAAEREAAMAKQRQYDKLIFEADKDFGSEKYSVAKGKYQQALSVKPNESYPKKKLDEIDKLLKSQQVAVSPTPVAKKSSGMSEAEIAAMMAKWQQERNQAKVDQMDQIKADLKVTDEVRTSSANDKRLSANDDLNELENTLAESNKAGKDRNLEEAMLVEEDRKDQHKFIADHSNDAEQNRNELYSNIQETEEGQKKIKDDGNQLYQINTELSATRKMELIQEDKSRSKEAHNGLLASHESIVEQEESWKEFKSDRKDAHMKDVENIQNENALVAASVRTWNDEDRESRHDAYDKIEKQEKEIHDFQADNAESYMENTRQYNKTVEELSAYSASKSGAANNNRKEAYSEITDYQKEVAELTVERHNRYDENNERIRKSNQEIIDQEAQLSAEADERRMKFDDNFYTGEKKPRYPELAREYSQGVTEESYEEDDAFVIKRIVVRGESINEYRKVYYKWGGIFYKKNDVDITETIWNAETQ